MPQAGEQEPDFSPDEQLEIVEWFFLAPALYDRTHTDWKASKPTKNAYWKEQADKMGCTMQYLLDWVKHQRTMYGKLTAEKSGQAAT